MPPIARRLEPVDRQRMKDLARKIIDEFDGTPVDIAVVAEYGSTGKSAFATFLLYELASHGLEVEGFDLDGQANLSKGFGIGIASWEDDDLLIPDGREGADPFLVVGDALVKRHVHVPGEPADTKRRVSLDEVGRCAYNSSGIKGLGVQVKPSNPRAEEIRETLQRIRIYPNGPSHASGEINTFYDDTLSLAKDPFGVLELESQVSELTTRPHVRIFDLHGTKSIIMIAALKIAKYAFTVVTPDDKSTGPELDACIQTIEEVQERNKKLELGMILVNRLDTDIKEGNHGKKILNRLHTRHGQYVPPVAIRDATSVREAYTEREPLPMWVPNHPVTDDFRAALLWGMERGLFG